MNHAVGLHRRCGTPVAPPGPGHETAHSPEGGQPGRCRAALRQDRPRDAVPRPRRLRHRLPRGRRRRADPRGARERRRLPLRDDHRQERRARPDHRAPDGGGGRARHRQPRGPCGRQRAARGRRERQALRAADADRRAHAAGRASAPDPHPACDRRRQRRPLDPDRAGRHVPHLLHPRQRASGDRHAGALVDADGGVVHHRLRAGAHVRLPQGPRLPAQERARARRLARQHDRDRQERHPQRAPLP